MLKLLRFLNKGSLFIGNVNINPFTKYLKKYSTIYN